MYLYNISIIVDNDRHESLLKWIKTTWLKTLPDSTKLLKLMDSPHEGHTYCVQLVFEYAADIPAFQNKNVIYLQEYIAQNHHEKAFIFDSTMKYI